MNDQYPVHKYIKKLESEGRYELANKYRESIILSPNGRAMILFEIHDDPTIIQIRDAYTNEHIAEIPKDKLIKYLKIK